MIVRLQNAGYETYLAGGAVRDILLNITPKDYDLSTEATPGQIRKVFGKKRTRIIGKRFKIVHLYYRDPKFNFVEISTFRKSPNKKSGTDESLIIKRDNLYGTSYEDAWRRDFTINSIFYDPVENIYKDFTEYGISDLNNEIIRSIGEPAVRFSEDPVRIIRALKLVAQYDFNLTDRITNSLPDTVDKILLCSDSRLMLELEKIFRKPYSSKTIEVFKRYGLLKYYLPFLNEEWGSKSLVLSLKLLNEYNSYCRKNDFTSHYTTSLALLSLPFVNKYMNDCETDIFWKFYPEMEKDIKKIIRTIFRPFTFSGYRLNSVCSTILLIKKMHQKTNITKTRLNPDYRSAREVFRIINSCLWRDEELMHFWENLSPKKRHRKIKKKQT